MVLDLEDDTILGKLIEGKWRLVRRIGRGGMGQVFQVVHARMGIVKCVKILRPGAEDVLVKRFEREVRLAQQIRHPNVIRIDDFGCDSDLDPSGVLFYLMEFVEGPSLREVLDGREIPVARAANLIRQTALGVHAAHEHDIIHRDIKPENVLVAGEEHVTVLDFGIAKLKSPDSREDMLTLTRKGEIWATPQYMSPEQAMASSDLTTSSDIYSLGVVLYECLTGEQPFIADTARGLILAHIQKPAPSIRKTRPELHFPEGLDSLVASMLEKRPDARPQSMVEVADALSSYMASAEPPRKAPVARAASPETVDVPAPSSAAAPAGRSPRRPTVRPARVVTVPHGPEQGGYASPRSRDFPVKAHLFVNLGEELHDHIIGRARVTLGRRTSNDILIPDQLASKLHAELIEDSGQFYMSDLHSRNGTFMGRQRVEGHVSLKPGDTVRIGNTYLIFAPGDAASDRYFAFCAEGHPNDPQARFCGSCGTKVLSGG